MNLLFEGKVAHIADAAPHQPRLPMPNLPPMADRTVAAGEPMSADGGNARNRRAAPTLLVLST